MNTKQIQTLIDNEQFIDLFDDNADESFYGYLIHQSDGLVQFESYDAEGRFDGVMVLDEDDISRIRWSNNEGRLTEHLISSRTQVQPLDLQSFTHAARSLNSRYGYVCLTMGASGTDTMFIGEIHEDEDGSVILHEYGTRARNERSFLLLRWDDVTRVQAGGVYEHNLHIQYNKLS